MGNIEVRSADTTGRLGSKANDHTLIFWADTQHLADSGLKFMKCCERYAYIAYITPLHFINPRGLFPDNHMMCMIIEIYFTILDAKSIARIYI